MDELERHIASLAEPQPSAALDARIEVLLKRKRPRGVARRRAVGMVALAICAVAAGFVLGRQTAPRGASVVSRQAGHDDPARPLVIVATDQRLADLFILPPARENFLGGGNASIEISSSNESRSLP